MLQLNTLFRTYFVIISIVVFAVMSLFWQYQDLATIKIDLYMVAASASYTILYMLPTILLTKIAIILLKPLKGSNKWRLWIVCFIAWLTSSLVVLLVFSDFKLFELYEYHFNGFVWNLITTPGGIEALGATDETNRTLLFQISGLFIFTAFLLWVSHSLSRTKQIISKRLFISVISLMIIVLAGEQSIYAYSRYTGKEDYIQAVDVIPFHLNSSASHFLKNMGIPRTGSNDLNLAKGKVKYPLSAIESEQLDNYPNIVMLVAESFRWDLLDPEITPNLWAFSKQSITFNQHYSGGNRTRMGLFSMFYGLSAPYWNSFEDQKVAPVLMDFIRSKDYQLALYTSQSFDYPELRNTTFAGIPDEFMQELKSGEPWKRDSQNITDIIDKLERSEKKKPSYTFMFFESTHAPYTFPDKAVIRSDYLKEMNYANLDLLNNAEGIHNRYINAAHHIDFEVGRLLDYLKQNNMLDNTIVLFTGDHGEEFMEKGHWGHGHNETFPEEQVHVPMVLWIPGEKPKQINKRTSHIQIPQTLLTHLGVTTPPEKYSLAGDLFSPLPFLTMGNYNYLSIFDGEFKVTFPFTSKDYFHYVVFDDKDDRVLRKDKNTVLESLKPMIDEAIKESRRFVE